MTGRLGCPCGCTSRPGEYDDPRCARFKFRGPAEVSDADGLRSIWRWLAARGLLRPALAEQLQAVAASLAAPAEAPPAPSGFEGWEAMTEQDIHGPAASAGAA